MSFQRSGKLMKEHIKKQRWILVLAITLIAVFYYRNTLGDIASEIRNLPASMTIISMLFMVFFYLIEGRLIQFVASGYASGNGLSWAKGTSIAYIGGFYRLLTMGAAAGPAEIYYLYREDIPISRATGMCLVKYNIHKMTITVYGIVSYLVLSTEMKSILLPYRTYIIIGSLITVLITIILTGVCTSKKIYKLVIWLLDKIPLKKEKWKEKISRLKESILLLQEEGRLLLKDWKKVLWIFLLNLCKLTCYYLIPAVFLFHRSNIRILNVVPLMAICNMLAGVLPAPSGIGSLEFVFLQLFQTLTETDIAASVILLYRFITWMMPFAIGGIFIVLERKRSARQSG